MSTGVIKIPVLFDMSGDSIVFGEEVSGDFVSSHLDFLLDMTTEANDISLNAADISSAILIGDNDTGDNIFYSGGSSSNIAVDNLCNRIAKTVTRGKLVHIPKSGDSSNSGIPMGGRAALVNALGEEGSLYATKYLTSISPIGDEQMLGQAMARVASVHLVGSPLSAGIFQDATQIQTDLETASGQTFNSGGTAFYNALAVQLSKVLGGSKSSAPMNQGKMADVTTYTVVESGDYDINKTVPARLATAAENQLLTDLVPSLKIVTGNSNAIFHTYHQQGSWASLPKGYFAIDVTGTATDNKYELLFNNHANPTGTGSEGGAYGENSWGIHKNVTPGDPLDASGVSVPALKSIYEQLMNVPGRSQIMETRDIGGTVDNSNATLTGGFPFITGDKLVMYLRPKIVFAAQTHAEQTTTLLGFPTVSVLQVPAYNIGRKSTAGGAISGQTYTESSADNEDSTANGFHRAFQGTKATDTSADPERWFSHDFHSGVNKKYLDTAPYAYQGVSETTNVDGSTTLDGEWGQVDIGQSTVINKFEIWPHLNGTVNLTNSSPATFSLLGSLDGTAWTTIKQVSGDTDWGTTGSPVNLKSYDLGVAHGPYRYYRLSIQNVNGNKEVVVVNELLLYGAKYPSEISEEAGAGLPTAQPTASAITDISGLITNVTATAANIETAFPGNATAGSSPETNKWGWMGSANSTMLTLETTDTNNVRTIDLHIWKITITL